MLNLYLTLTWALSQDIEFLKRGGETGDFRSQGNAGVRTKVESHFVGNDFGMGLGLAISGVNVKVHCQLV